MNQNNNAAQENGLPNCGQLIQELPFWTRVVYFCMGACWLLDFVTGMPGSMVGSSVDNTLRSYKLWTLLTGSFYVDSLFFMVLIIYNFNSFLPKLEERISTPILMLGFLLNGALIHLLTLSLQSLLGYEQGKSPVNGIEGIWFCMLFKYCYFNSQSQIKFCCFPWKFKRSLYPYVLLPVCMLLKFSIPLSMVVGLLYGLLQVTIERYTTRLSARFCYNKLSSVLGQSSIKCWIRYSSHSEGEEFSDRSGFQNLENFVGGGLTQTESPDSSVNKDPFSSKKGVRIGDY